MKRQASASTSSCTMVSTKVLERPKSTGILPRAAGGEHRQRLAVLPQAGAGELRGAAAGDPFLHDDGVVADQRGGAPVERDQRLAVVGPPSLGQSEGIGALPEGRLQDHREAAVQPAHLVEVARLEA